VKLGGGGIVAALLVYAVASVFGLDISGLLSGGGGGAPIEAPSSSQPPPGPDPEAEQMDFIRDVMKDIQDTFDGLYRAAGKPYRRAKLYVFREAIDTRCGRSSSAIGPFYCPPDQKVYIDLAFYKDLRDRFKAPGDFAQAYVIAHEVGHHVQQQLGVMEKLNAIQGRVSKTQLNQAQVRIELQADCYAGVWAHHAGNAKLLDPGDVEEGLTAAAAIGDDRIQKQTQGTVVPESFTHGSSAQRMRWFKRGMESGRAQDCDTLNASAL